MNYEDSPSPIQQALRRSVSTTVSTHSAKHRHLILRPSRTDTWQWFIRRRVESEESDLGAVSMIDRGLVVCRGGWLDLKLIVSECWGQGHLGEVPIREVHRLRGSNADDTELPAKVIDCSMEGSLACVLLAPILDEHHQDLRRRGGTLGIRSPYK